MTYDVFHNLSHMLLEAKVRLGVRSQRLTDANGEAGSWERNEDAADVVDQDLGESAGLSPPRQRQAQALLVHAVQLQRTWI